MYAIDARYIHMTADGYYGARHVPTFYLDERVQGIVNDAQAIRIAREILTACVRDMPANDTLHVHVTYLGKAEVSG